MEPQKKHLQQGLRNMDESRTPELMDWTLVDEKIVIDDSDAFDYARRLAREEGIFGGISCGTAMFGSLQVAKRMDHGTVVTIFPDRGEKYFSTSLFL